MPACTTIYAQKMLYISCTAHLTTPRRLAGSELPPGSVFGMITSRQAAACAPRGRARGLSPRQQHPPALPPRAPPTLEYPAASAPLCKRTTPVWWAFPKFDCQRFTCTQPNSKCLCPCFDITFESTSVSFLKEFALPQKATHFCKRDASSEQKFCQFSNLLWRWSRFGTVKGCMFRMSAVYVPPLLGSSPSTQTPSPTTPGLFAVHHHLATAGTQSHGGAVRRILFADTPALSTASLGERLDG
jgi:hypothetical protein